MLKSGNVTGEDFSGLAWTASVVPCTKEYAPRCATPFETSSHSSRFGGAYNKMKYSFIIACFIAFLTSSCATAPYAEEKKLTLKEAIVSAARALTEAEQQIINEKLKTYNLRPSKATVSFDLSTVRGEGNSAELTVAPPSVPVSGVFGWSATKQVQKGSHVEIEFTPTE